MTAQGGIAARPVAPLVPFVGRVAQLPQLVRAVRQPPAVVRVEGEAGIGKTRLLRELLVQPALRGRTVLFGTCQFLHEPFPLGSVIEALRQGPAALWEPADNPLLAALRPLLPELDHRLPPALPPLADRRAERHRTFRAIRAALSAAGPAVLVLDDLHWADEATLEFLRFLITELPAELALVASYRVEPDRAAEVRGVLAGRGCTTTVTVPPMSGPEVELLAEAILGRGPLPKEFGRAVHERTAGVSLAVEEVLRALRDRIGDRLARGVHVSEVLDEVGVPTGLRDAVLERVARLGCFARDVVHAAAVLGTDASERELVGVAGLDEYEGADALLEALGSQVLREVPGERYEFRHVLAQQAVYQDLAGPERRRRHRLAAELLLRLPVPPEVQVARHLRRAGDPAGWRTHCERGADRAIAVGDIGAGVGLLQELLADPAQDDQNRARLAIKLGRAALDGLEYHETIRVLRGMLTEVALPPGVRGELRNDLGTLLFNQAGDHAAGFAELERAVTELRATRPALAARAMASLSIPHVGHQHIDVHLGWLAMAERLGEQVTDPLARAAVLVNCMTTLMSCGQPRAWVLAERLLEVPEDREIARHLMRGCLNAADASAWLGYYAKARRYLEHGSQLAESFHVVYTEELLQVTEVLLDWLAGRWTGLRQRANRLAERYSELPRTVAECQLVCGAIAAAEGDADEALARLSIVDTVAAGGAPPPIAVTASAVIAELLGRRSATVPALRGIERALEVLRGSGMWVWGTEAVPVAVDLFTTAERIPDAVRVVREFRAGIQGRDCPVAAASLALSEAILLERQGNQAEAIDRYDLAERRFAALPRPQSVARVRFARGRCLFEAGEDGTADLLAAVDLAGTLGATALAEQCRGVLAAYRALPTRRRGRPGYGTRLSPREVEVTRLAVAGQTNREIGAQLGLSPRTVEQHVCRAMRKVGVTSRGELGVAVQLDSG